MCLRPLRSLCTGRTGCAGAWGGCGAWGRAQPHGWSSVLVAQSRRGFRNTLSVQQRLVVTVSIAYLCSKLAGFTQGAVRAPDAAMALSILSYGQPFSNYRYEAEFQAAHAASQHRQDRLAGWLGFITYGALCLRAWNVHSRMFMLTAMPALVLRFLVPLVCPGPNCARGGARAFAPCRLRMVVVLRLIGGLTVSLLDPAFFKGPPFLEDTPAGNLSALVLSTLVPDALLGALGFR